MQGAKLNIYLRCRYLVEPVIACILMLILLPILVVVALMIKLTSPGPVFFIQTRMGQNQQPFPMYKFRSMHISGEAELKFAEKDDVRITKFGAFIRRSRIDELPQMLNILKGEMSFIGPRPEQFQFATKFAETIPDYHHRHLLKPGITGLAQVKSGYAFDEDTTRVKLKYDLEYVAKVGFLTDIWITLKTITTLLSGFGAR